MKKGDDLQALSEEEYSEAFTKEIVPIARFQSCFPEKFGVPRQAGIAKKALGVIELLPPFDHETYLEGLELYSHIWLTFGFHQNRWNGRATVRPQRLGGNMRMGVFATRSSFRPNGLGLSAVKIESIDRKRGEIAISGHDLVAGTPIYCIKPYIPFSDGLQEATSDFAMSKPQEKPVVLSTDAERALQRILENGEETYPDLRALIIEVIGQNPAPQFHHDTERIYGVSLYDLNIEFKRFHFEEREGFLVLSIVKTV